MIGCVAAFVVVHPVRILVALVCDKSVSLEVFAGLQRRWFRSLAPTRVWVARAPQNIRRRLVGLGRRQARWLAGGRGVGGGRGGSGRGKGRDLEQGALVSGNWKLTQPARAQARSPPGSRAGEPQGSSGLSR